MRERAIAAVLLSLPAVYVAALLLPAVTAGAVAVPIGFALTIVVSAGLVVPGDRARTVALLLGLVLAVTVGVAFADGSALGNLPFDLAAGVLLGLPWVATVHTWRPREAFGWRTVAVGASTLVALLDLSTASDLTASGTALSGNAFVSNFASTNVSEAQGIASLVSAGALNPPVQSFFDPVFAAVTGLAILGFLLLAIRPQTGAEVPLPIALHGTAASPIELPEVYGFSAEQRDAYRERSPDEPPGVPWPPGLDAVVVAALASAIFVGVALLTPYYAVFGVTLGLTAAVVVLLLLTDRPAPFVPVEEEPPFAEPSPPPFVLPEFPTPPPPPSAGG